MAMITIRLATESDLDALRDFHVTNHLDETCRCPGERDRQIEDLRDDFRHLYSVEEFRRGTFWLATTPAGLLAPSVASSAAVVGSSDGGHYDADADRIVGCIGLTPDNDDDPDVTWLNTFSVAKEMRGQKLGSRLLELAVEKAPEGVAESASRKKAVRLITLGGHSEGKNVMGAARYLYEKNGFELYSRETVEYGHSTTIDVLKYERILS